MSKNANDLLPRAELESPAMVFLDALARRDLDGLAASLAPDARMRALVPPGFRDFDGREAVAGKFRDWFGADQEFEMLEAAATTVGPRLQLRWRVRLTPPGGAAAVLVEQTAFIEAGSRVQAIDLLCSGFVPEYGATQGN
jgi:hypothetical protein